MCGKELPEPTAEIAVSAEPARSRRSEPTTPAPAYTGGIFNLGAPAEPPSRNLDYLLEDDEEPKSHTGWVLLVVVALLLVAGLGWLRWRREGLPLSGLLTAGKATTPAGAPNADSPASPSPQTGSSVTPASPASQPEQNPPSVPGADAQPAPAATTSGAPAAPSSSSPSATASSEQPAPSKPPDAGSEKAITVITAPADAKPAATADTAKAREAVPTPAPETRPASRKPSPAPKPSAKPPDTVTLGERYLYGRNGVPQNCDRGLRYIKPAADQSNPKAMITMGALYATGHCLSRDLPTAYRYFALALRVDPENGPLRQNVDMVWKQMTAEERKQAIRLTQ